MKSFLGYSTLTLISVGLVALFAMPAAYAGSTDNNPQTPFIQKISPEAVLPGAVITADGEFLGKALVIDLYVTRGGTDFKLTIISQKSDKIVAKLPAQMEPGRYRLMVLTPGLEPRLIEQPVQVTVE